jgi:hypothetical protein
MKFGQLVFLDEFIVRAFGLLKEGLIIVVNKIA